jgi:hypothetical protein
VFCSWFFSRWAGVFCRSACEIDRSAGLQKSLFLLKKFARAFGVLKNPWMKSLVTRVLGCHRHGLDLAANRKHIRRRFALNEKIYP